MLYDADGRLALCNSTYKDFYDYADAEVAPGVHFEDLVRLDIEKGTVKSLASGDEGHFRVCADCHSAQYDKWLTDQANGLPRKVRTDPEATDVTSSGHAPSG